MKNLPLLCFFIIGLMLSNNSETHAQVNAQSARLDGVYSSDDRSNVLAVINGRLYIGSLAPDDQFEMIPQLIGSQGRLESRSNRQMECVSSGNITFAVPINRRLNQNFWCNGLEFSVERCSNASSRDSCGSYEIVARCRHFQNGRCVSGRGAVGGHGLAYRFRGSTHAGITEINFDLGSERGGLTLREGRGIFGKISPPSPRAVDVRSGGDDGLTQSLAAALETAVRRSDLFTLSGRGRPARLVFEIPGNVGWTEIGGRVRVHFQVDFKAGDGRVIGRSIGTCWETNLEVCVALVVSDARRVSSHSSR